MPALRVVKRRRGCSATSRIAGQYILLLDFAGGVYSRVLFLVSVTVPFVFSGEANK
jgi:hypothetical protein